MDLRSHGAESLDHQAPPSPESHLALPYTFLRSLLERVRPFRWRAIDRKRLPERRDSRLAHALPVGREETPDCSNREELVQLEHRVAERRGVQAQGAPEPTEAPFPSYL